MYRTLRIAPVFMMVALFCNSCVPLNPEELKTPSASPGIPVTQAPLRTPSPDIHNLEPRPQKPKPSSTELPVQFRPEVLADSKSSSGINLLLQVSGSKSFDFRLPPREERKALWFLVRCTRTTKILIEAKNTSGEIITSFFFSRCGPSWTARGSIFDATTQGSVIVYKSVRVMLMVFTGPRGMAQP